MQNNDQSNKNRLQELRHKAEQSLKDFEAAEDGQQEFEDIQQVLQELSVYQVELSMQNEELQIKQEQLERTSNDYRRLYDFAPAGFFVFDESGIIEEVNRQGSEILGSEQRSLYGKPFMLYLDSSHQRHFSDHRRRIFTGRGDEEEITLKLKTRTGKTTWVRIKSIVVEHGLNRSKRCFTAMQDITSQIDAIEKLKKANQNLEKSNAELLREIKTREKIEQELIRSKDAAEAATRAKSAFLANMSHEIRTPLNGIYGMLQLMEDTSLDHDQKELVQTAMISAQGIMTILADIIDFAGMDKSGLELENHPFDLRRVLQQTTDSLTAEAKNKGVSLWLSLDDHIPATVCGDQGRVRQLYFNLLSNAVKFSCDGDVTVTAFVLRRSDEMVQLGISIKDCGPGIEDELIYKVFEPFTQADGSFTRKYGGLGLGLSIARELIKAMGGTISLDTEQGKGTELVFTLKLGLECPEKV